MPASVWRCRRADQTNMPLAAGLIKAAVNVHAGGSVGNAIPLRKAYNSHFSYAADGMT
jgi:hypothetical protein